jgi:hypothetical protein
MTRQFVTPPRPDIAPLMLVRLRTEELQRASARARLADLVRSARPRDRSPLKALVWWFCAGWSNSPDQWGIGEPVQDDAIRPAAWDAAPRDSSQGPHGTPLPRAWHADARVTD